MTADEKAIVEGAPDAWTGLFDLVRKQRAEMRRAEAAHAFKTFRVYSFEEEADDFAMTVLHDEGKDPVTVGTSLLGYLVYDDQRTKCSAAVAAGEVPAYGGLLDPHHSICFRVYHAKAFAAHLAAGGNGVEGHVVPRGVRPTETVRRGDPESPVDIAD